MHLDLEDFIFEVVLPAGFSLGLIFVVGMMLVGSCDGIQSIRARSATFACQRQNLRAVRKAFSTEVACTARNLGSDTLNVRESK